MSNVKNTSQSLVVAIDDDPSVLSFYTGALEKICKLQTFEDPEQGLNFILQNSVVLAIIDRRFPKFPHLSGDDICRELRSHPKTQTLPIIIVSGVDEIEEITKLMKQNKIDTYITKPIIESNRFLSQVSYYLANKQK